MAEAERFSPSWLEDTEPKRIAKLLGKGNCRFVGGAVRDSLLDLAISDIDVATPLLPEIAAEKLQEGGVKVVPTGLKHGTITAIVSGRHFEITTLRQDVETYGRHAQVAFHDDWEADAARRDFTINALYLSPDGVLDDYYGGQQDLAERRVRFIGDPKERIAEDALRILRFFRFHAHYGKGELDPDGLQACEEAAGLIASLSPERIAAESKKLLAAPDPLPTLAVMAERGLLQAILVDPFDLDPLMRLVETEINLSVCDALRRLASLLPDGVGAAQRIAIAFRLSNKEKSRLLSIVERQPMTKAGMARSELWASLYCFGLQAVEDALIINSPPEDIERLKADLKTAEAFDIPTFPVNGEDLLALGAKKGPGLGEALDVLEKNWIDSGFKLSKEALLEEFSPD